MDKKVFGEKYQLKDFISKSLNANLYFAADLDTDELVVLRVFSKNYSHSINDPEEFLQINQSISFIGQPGHVEILDWGIDNDQLFTVWPGDSVETVETVLSNHAVFKPEVAVHIIKEVALVLSEVFDQTGVGHYALSPGNIYLDSKGTVRLSDLGFAAQLFKDPDFLARDIDFYDWHFQAPEIVLDSQSPDVQSDMFSLGYCLKTMIQGQVPFDHVKPVSHGDYISNNRFTKEEENLFGESFMSLYNGLTSTIPENRFINWQEAIHAMDFYLREVESIKEGRMSGRLRSLKTEFDIENYCKEHNLMPRKRDESRESQPRTANEIRQNSKIHIVDLPVKKNRKTARLASQRKSRSNPAMIIVAVAIILLAAGMFFLVVKLQKQEEQAVSKKVQTTAPQIKEAPKKSSSVPKTVPTKNGSDAARPQDKVIVQEELPDPKRKRDLTDLDIFNELAFQVRELTIRREWQKAVDLLSTYNGPLKEKQELLKHEILRQQQNFIDNKGKIKIAINTKSMPIAVTPLVDNTPSLENLARLVYSGSIEAAVAILPSVEVTAKVDLKKLNSYLNKATDTALTDILAENYAKEIGKEIDVNINGHAVKGQIIQVLSQEGSLKLNITYMARKFERIVFFDQLDTLTNVKRISTPDSSESTLLQFIYLIKRKQIKAAQQKLMTYTGVLSKELLLAMDQVKNDEAAQNWNRLLTQHGIISESSEQELREFLNKYIISPDDSWALNFKLNEFSERYSTTAYFKKVKSLLAVLEIFLRKKISLIKKPDAVVSPTGRPGTITLEAALERVGDGGTIRLLPGFYKDPVLINRQIRLIGTKEVYFGNYVTLNVNQSEIHNVVIEKGFIDISRNINDVKIINCVVAQGNIILRGDNSVVRIENSVCYGLKAGKNKHTAIIDSVILENSEKGTNCAISGYISGTISNTIIRSNEDFAMVIQDKGESSLSVRHCMIFGLKGLANIVKGNITVQRDSDFNKFVGRTVSLKIAKPQFIDEANLNFQLKDFSPGFLEGEAKKSIGVQ